MSNGRRLAAQPIATTALLLIDVMNDLAFLGSEALVGQAERWQGVSRCSNVVRPPQVFR